MPKQEGFFASAAQLEMHKGINRQQVQLASELVHSLERLKTLEGFQADERYQQLMKKAQESLHFLEAMSAFLNDFQDQVLETSYKVKKMLTETTEASAMSIRKR
jgi:4-diphosphocytidyl-2C-methyl-D-erythritol kinase